MTAAVLTTGLAKRFGSTVALDGLDLEVLRGEVYGFLGPNGAGKTTTIRLLLGLLRPGGGVAAVLGLDPWADTVALHGRIAYIPGDFSIWPWLTGGEALAYLGRLHGGVDAAYRDELVDVFGFDPDRLGRSYSRGNRQKIAVIAAFATRADLLVLDEPTSGLDPLMVEVFEACVREARARGQTVFLSSHILSEVEQLCDRVGILREGRLVDVGALDDVRHLAARTFEITFRGAAPDLGDVPGVDVVTSTGHALRCHVRGDVAPLLRALAGHDVVDLASREASLEEVFLAHYGSGGVGGAP